MIELTSTPIILMVILGVAGMIIPVINVIRKERGSSTFYGVIAFGALLPVSYTHLRAHET